MTVVAGRCCGALVTVEFDGHQGYALYVEQDDCSMVLSGLKGEWLGIRWAIEEEEEPK